MRFSISCCWVGISPACPRCCSPTSGPEDGSEKARSEPVRFGSSGRWCWADVPSGVPEPQVSPRCPAGLPGSGLWCPVVPVNEEEAPSSLLAERATRDPMANPISAKKPYFRKRLLAGSLELTALLASLA